MASPLLAGLSEAGLLEPTLAAWLADEEVQTVTDLIHCFRTEADALRSAPIAHAACALALGELHRAGALGAHCRRSSSCRPRPLDE